MSMLVKGMKRTYLRPTVQKLPFQRSDIRRFIKMASERECAKTWRSAVILTLCFAQFLRFAEAAFLKLEDIVVTKGALQCRVRSSKNHRTGFSFTVPVEERKYCIGTFVKGYLVRALRWAPGARGYLCCRFDAGRGFIRRSE